MTVQAETPLYHFPRSAPAHATNYSVYERPDGHPVGASVGLGAHRRLRARLRRSDRSHRLTGRDVMRDGRSSYLQYLPKVLWEDEPPPPAFSLGCYAADLREGADRHRRRRGDRPRRPRAPAGRRDDRAPARARRPLADPARLPAWLAEWVALELPDAWTEYQQRRATAQVADIYQPARTPRRDARAARAARRRLAAPARADRRRRADPRWPARERAAGRG